jgi:hypothetical protein
MPCLTDRRLRALLVLLLMAVTSGPFVAAQSQGGAAAPWAGDLQGTWNYSTLTPLERPAEFEGRATMSKEEAARFVRQVMERNNADRRDGGVDADVARAYNDAWYDRGNAVAIVNGESRTSLLVSPADGRVPALTPDAQQRQATRLQVRRDHPADGPEDRSLGERCLGFNAGPPMLPGPYNNYVQIFPFARQVVIFNEMIHDARVVPTDGRKHLPSTVRRYQGDSVGRWEGKTLIVETTNFTDKTNFRGATENMRLVERFTRTGPDSLLYEFTVTDPAAFTAPWSVALPMTRSDEPVFEYACHEGNEAMLGILRGARFGEKNAKP